MCKTSKNTHHAGMCPGFMYNIRIKDHIKKSIHGKDIQIVDSTIPQEL